MQKKGIFILLLLIIGICAVSTASAADDVDTLSSEDSNLEEISTDLEDNLLEKSSKRENLAEPQDSSISKDTSDETLSVVYSSWYTINLQDFYDISSNKKETISYYMAPCTYSSESYHFYLRAVDLNGNIVFNSELKGTGTTARDYHPSFEKNTFAPGTYVLGAVNYDDNVVMDTAILRVSGTALINANNYNSYYNSGAKITVRMTDQTTGNPITSSYINVKFTNTKTKKTVTQKYLMNSDGQISFTPPVGAGTFSVTFSPSNGNLKADSVKRTLTVKKSGVSVKAKKVSEYKGYKVTLKATVKSNGKNVNEGKVVFKIKGKKYYANVKNGVATKKVKLYKVKKYFYSATYLGTNNLYKSKKSVAKATLKKSYKVKIYAPNPSVYVGQKKYCTIKIRTTDGKKVKKTFLTIGGARYYFNGSGVRVTGFFKVRGKHYYASPSNGALVKGWKKINGKWYYFDPKTMVRAKGWKTINGQKCYFNSKGVLKKGKHG